MIPEPQRPARGAASAGLTEATGLAELGGNRNSRPAAALSAGAFPHLPRSRHTCSVTVSHDARLPQPRPHRRGPRRQPRGGGRASLCSHRGGSHTRHSEPEAPAQRHGPHDSLCGRRVPNLASWWPSWSQDAPGGAPGGAGNAPPHYLADGCSCDGDSSGADLGVPSQAGPEMRVPMPPPPPSPAPGSATQSRHLGKQTRRAPSADEDEAALLPRVASSVTARALCHPLAPGSDRTRGSLCMLARLVRDPTPTAGPRLSLP